MRNLGCIIWADLLRGSVPYYLLARTNLGISDRILQDRISRKGGCVEQIEPWILS
jgi:hypothetical protein